jgi:hypothetical protein
MKQDCLVQLPESSQPSAHKMFVELAPKCSTLLTAIQKSMANQVAISLIEADSIGVNLRLSAVKLCLVFASLADVAKRGRWGEVCLASLREILFLSIRVHSRL